LALGIALAEHADQPHAWPGLGRFESGPLQLVVVPDRESLHRLSRGLAPRWGVALALPAQRMIAIRADAPNPLAALRHELAHLALRRVVQVRVPLWFQEGYAVVAAGEWGRLSALQLNLAVVRGAVLDLPRLDAALRRSAGEAETAYALAGSAVAFLARLHPSGDLAPLLARLQAGQAFEAAVLATTGYTLEQLDRVWRSDVRRRHGWLVWLGAGGLWLLVSGLVVVVVVLKRQSDRPRRAALDEGWELPVEAMQEAGDPRPLDRG
jgi:hypothetical protein